MNDAFARLAKKAGHQLGACNPWLVWICVGMAVLFGAILLFAFDPAQVRLFPRCIFHELTGLNCPGCGGQRALHHLLHGDLAQAFRCNALLVGLLPLGMWVLARHACHSLLKHDLPALFKHHLWSWALVVIVIAFGTLRNLPFPALSWLNP